MFLAPTQVAIDHLAAEGLSGRSVLVGDVMVDVCFQVRDAALADGLPAKGLLSRLDMAAPYPVCTLHRPDNTDDRADSPESWSASGQ